MNAAPPVISIVTPNYNGVDYLSEAIESVLGQRYPALQYVIADGASTDGSRLVAEQYRDQLCGLISEPDEGHADAINKSFALTDGEIMGWINSDDILHPGCLSQVSRIFESYPEVEWITGRPSAMDARGELNYVGPVRAWSRLRFLAGDHLWIQQESTFWRRSLWEKAGGRLDTDLKVANDFELWSRFFRHADLYSVDRMFGCFRVRPGQRSVVDQARYQREVRRVLARELDQLEPEFRSAFPGLIPDKPRQLDEAQRKALDPLLDAIDAPVIQMASVRSGRKLDAGGPRFRTGGHTPEAVSDLSAFRNRHAGQRCFVMGNGPSLRETDLSLLEGETVFACNAVHLLFDQIEWRPTYFTCVDSQVLVDRAPDFEAMLSAHPDITAFFPAELQVHGGGRERLPTREYIAEAPNRVFFNETTGSVEDLPRSMFSLDAADHVIRPHTVAVTMLQLAAYMGFSEIILLGCDMRYVVPETARGEPGAGPDDPRLVSSQDDDPNHFDPRYFGAGRKWHRPSTALMREHFEISRQALEGAGIRVFNATVGGDLDVFERLSLKEAVARPAPQIRAAAPEPTEAEPTTAEPTGQTEPAPKRAAAETGLGASVKRNWTALAAAAAGLAAMIAGAILLPEWRIWIVMFGLFAAGFGFTVALALKTRRIVLSLKSALEDSHKHAAETALAREKQELELDALYAELHALRHEAREARRP